jgi:two-component system sensor histidine kinase AtoS
LHFIKDLHDPVDKAIIIQASQAVKSFSQNCRKVSLTKTKAFDGILFALTFGARSFMFTFRGENNMFIFKRGFGGQLLTLIAILLILPIILTVYMLHAIKRTELALVENHKAKLSKVMDLLDSGFHSSFDEILKENNATDATRREKVQILNRKLKSEIVEIGRSFPGVELGFYSHELDVILDGDNESYGENFSKRRKQSFEEATLGSKKVTDTFGKPEGGYLETYQPLVRNGKVIGAVWARENLVEIYERVEKIQRDAYLIIFFGVVVGVGGCFALIGSFLHNVKQVKKGVQTLESDLTRILPSASGELGDITTAINHLAARLVNIQN